MAKFNSIAKFFNAIGGAFNAAAVLNTRRDANIEQLRAMGVDPAEFTRLSRKV